MKSAFLVVCGLALLGCSDDPVSPTGVSGSLAFSYTGAGATSATTYSASGTIPLNIGSTSNFGSSAWAAGSVDPTSDFVAIGAAIPKGSATWDITSIGIARKTVGSSSIEDCDIDAEECTSVIVIFGQGQNQNSFSQGCVLTTGTVTITAISSSNITGTFSGTGSCLSGTTGAETAFTVTNGTFNVGVTTQLLD